MRGFYEWLVKPKPLGRGVSEGYARDLLSYARRPFDPGKRYSVVAYRLLLKYIELRYRVDVDGFLKRLKIPRTGVDLKVPSEDLILESLEYLRGIETRRRDYYQLYLLLLASGVRLCEAQLFLAGFGGYQALEQGGVRVYAVNYQRGSKAVFYVFTPSWLRLRRDRVNWETHGPHRGVPVKPKYVRKFVATKMFELDIPAEVIDFIQGRTPRSILAQHYLNLLPKAVREYAKYAEWLHSFLERANVPVD